ncbi:MAG TPA: ABC transporter ATP-binding protein [Bacillota bacterium]
MTGRPMVAAEGLRVAYGAGPVVDGVDLRVMAGEWVSILGPNGSGKTTLLRAIGSYLQPVDGAVSVAGRGAASYGRRELARMLAAVGVDLPAEFPLSVSDFVMLGRIPHGSGWGWTAGRDQAVVEHALEQTGMTRFADRPLDRLSAGERQRALLARALAQEPAVLLLDEPTAHLDIHRQVETLDMLAQFKARNGLTVIAVLHDINLAALYSDRLVLMRDGRVVAEGPPADTLTRENVERVFGCRVAIQRHPERPVPQVVVLGARPAGASRSGAETGG